MIYIVLLSLYVYMEQLHRLFLEKRPPTDWERIFTNPKSDRELISNIYKERKKVDSRKLNYPIKKWGSELKKKFSPEE